MVPNSLSVIYKFRYTYIVAYTKEERALRAREAGKRWRQKNPDYASKYYIANRERLLIKQNGYRLEHIEEIKVKKRRTVGEDTLLDHTI
jgi:hypothetical protein